MTKKDFLETIEKFLLKEGISPSSFGMKAVNDPSFVDRVRAGRECREETQNRVLEFMRTYEEERGSDGQANTKRQA